MEDLESNLERSRAEKDGLTRDVLQLTASLSSLRGTVKALEQRCSDYDAKIARLEREVQSGKDEHKFLKDMHAELTNQLRSVRQKLDDTEHLNSVISQRNKNNVQQISHFQERQGKLEREITALGVEVKTARSARVQQEAQCERLREELGRRERERLVILKGASEKEAQLTSVRREAAALASERSALRTQLDARSSEVAAREDRIRVLERDLARAEREVRERSDDVRLLKVEVENLRRTEAILRHQNSAAESLRIEVGSVHQQLVEEKLRAKTVEEELHKSQNVHRYSSTSQKTFLH